MGNIFDPKRALDQSHQHFMYQNAFIFGSEDAIDQRVSKLVAIYTIKYYGTEIPQTIHELMLNFIRKNKHDYNQYFIDNLMSCEHLIKKSKYQAIWHHKGKHYYDNYQYGLFECHQDPFICLDVCCCPCISVAEIVNKNTDYSKYSGCMLCCCAPCLYPCLVTPKVRDNNHINSNNYNCLQDMFRCYLCGGCELCVHLKETRGEFQPNCLQFMPIPYCCYPIGCCVGCCVGICQLAVDKVIK